MSQVTSGIHAIFSHPIIYKSFQNIMGARAMREDLVANFIRPSSGWRILDIGCGTADILAHLPEGVEYWGYDISDKYIAAARRRFGGRGHFECRKMEHADVVNLPKFDAVLAIGVLHHLDDEFSLNFFKLSRAVIKPNGRVITIDPCLTAGQNPIARYLILQDRGQNVRDAEGYRILAARVFPRIIGSLRHRNWIPYTHWIMECTV